MKVTKRITVKPYRCLGCASCLIACAVAHSESGDLVMAIREDPPPEPRNCLVAVEEEGGFAGRFQGVPLQCRHCDDAPCIAVCPSGALTRSDENDLVVVEQDRCIGCRACVEVCPFGIVHMARNGRAVIKCDLCIARLERGEEPACVSACPTGALRFEELEEAAIEKRQRAAGELLAGASKEKGTGEGRTNG